MNRQFLRSQWSGVSQLCHPYAIDQAGKFVDFAAMLNG